MAKKPTRAKNTTFEKIKEIYGPDKSSASLKDTSEWLKNWL
jgi:hypothetical protein